MPKFRIKSAWFGYFCAAIWKRYCDIWNEHSRICLIVKFPEKTKMLHLGLKMPYLGTFGEEYFKKLSLYLKSASSNLCICKI